MSVLQKGIIPGIGINLWKEKHRWKQGSEEIIAVIQEGSEENTKLYVEAMNQQKY